MQSATEGADIFYTADGTEPTRESSRYAGDIPLAEAGAYQISAIAVKFGMADSQVTSIMTSVGQAAAPTAYPEPGEISSDKGISLQSETPGAAIYFTTDGTAPDLNSSRYNGYILLNKTATIKAIAYKPGSIPSKIAEFAYTVKPQGQVYPPWFIVEDVIDGKLIYLNSMTEGASIVYSIDGSDPTRSGALYEDYISMTKADRIVIRAIAYKEGMKPSQIVSLTVVVEQVVWPRADHETGYVDRGASVDLLSPTDGAAIHYTVDGSEPDENSDVLDAPITITENTTVRTKAYKNGMAASNERIYDFLVEPPIDDSGLPPINSGPPSDNSGSSSDNAGPPINDAEPPINDAELPIADKLAIVNLGE
jgi:hypothetical protein